MMNTHDPSKKELKQISIFVGTWNMGERFPSILGKVFIILRSIYIYIYIYMYIYVYITIQVFLI